MDIDTLELEFPWNDYLLETDPKETDPKEKVQPKAIARPDRDHDQPDQKSAGSFLDPIQRRNLPRNLMVMARNLMVMRTALA